MPEIFGVVSSTNSQYTPWIKCLSNYYHLSSKSPPKSWGVGIICFQIFHLKEKWVFLPIPLPIMSNSSNSSEVALHIHMKHSLISQIYYSLDESSITFLNEASLSLQLILLLGIRSQTHSRSTCSLLHFDHILFLFSISKCK